MNIVLLGPPGGGKGSQAKLLVQKFNYVHISTGDLFRKHLKNNTELGLIVRGYVDNGLLVPDEITNAILKDALIENKNALGIILDGYPRNVAQAEELNCICQEVNCKLDLIINLEVPNEVIINRLVYRVICTNCGNIYNTLNHKFVVSGHCDNCGSRLITRRDDEKEVVLDRLDIYYQVTKPVIEFYEKRTNIPVEHVNGADNHQIVLEKLAKIIIKHDSH